MTADMISRWEGLTDTARVGAYVLAHFCVAACPVFAAEKRLRSVGTQAVEPHMVRTAACMVHQYVLDAPRQVSLTATSTRMLPQSQIQPTVLAPG
jgi:hypothetical protein